MIDAAIAACRILFDSAALFLWGSSAYLAVSVPSGLRTALWQRLAAARLFAMAALLLATATILPLRTLLIAGTVDAGMLMAVATGTNVGTAWMVQMATALVLLLALLALPKTLAPAVTALLGAILLASLSLTGHAAMNSGALGLLQGANNALHLLAGGAWIGALPVLLLLLPLLRDPARRPDALLALRRFSNGGHVAVALVIASGFLSTWLITGTVLPWPSSPYRGLLLIKIALVAAMVVTAIVNRYVIVPRMRADARAGRALAIGTLTEIGLVTLVIGLVGVFGMLEPGT